MESTGPDSNFDTPGDAHDSTFCTTCALTTIVWHTDEPEPSASQKPVLRKLSGTPGWRWNKKTLTVGFYQPTGTGVTPVQDFDKLILRMFQLMQNWTASGPVAKEASTKWPENKFPTGANLEITQWKGLPKDLLSSNGPDIRVQVRNLPEEKREYLSSIGRDSVTKMELPSMTLDLGHITEAALARIPAAGKSNRILGLFEARVQHEFGHALGFMHEHLRADFQQTNFGSSKEEKLAKKELLARLQGAFPDLTPVKINSNILNIPDKGDAPKIIIWSNPPDEHSILMYPFGFVRKSKKDPSKYVKPDHNDADSNGPLYNVLTGQSTGKEIPFNTRLSLGDMVGAAKAYH